MPGARRRQLLAKPATAANNRELYALLQRIEERELPRRLPGGTGKIDLVKLNRQVDALFTNPVVRDEAWYWITTALQDIQSYGKVQALIGVEAVEVPTGGESPELPIETDGLSAAAAAAIESVSQLDVADIAIVASTLKGIARERAEREAAEREAGRADALQKVRRYTDQVTELRAHIDTEVIRARGFGASWGQIGDACGLDRSSALRRWGKEIEADESGT